MDKLKELRERVEALVVSMQTVLDLAASENRDLTEAEEAEYRGHEAEIEKIKADIARREKLLALEQEARAAHQASSPVYIPNYRGRANGDPPREWRNIGEFIHALRFNRRDPRLADSEYVEFGPEVREQSMGVGSEGGYALPAQFRPELLQVQPQEAIFRPRASIIPAGDPPDAAVTMPALDQGAGANVYGGVVVYPVGEGGSLQESSFKLREVTLTPHQFGGYIIVSNKLLNNWQAAGGFIGGQLRKAMIGYEDTAFYSGNGVGKPKGVIKQKALITVTRGTANTVVSLDCYNMLSRLKMGGSPVWIASQTLMPQLLTLKGGNSENIFNFDIRSGVGWTLLGYPVLFNDRSVALGTSGDLVLADLGYYLIKDGSGPYLDVSEHVYFTSARTVIRIIWAVDGDSWLTEAFPLEGSTSNTVSPFIVLS